MLGKHSAGRQPSGCSIGAVFGPRIESNGGSRRGSVDRVDDGLEQRKAPGRQADTSADYDAVAARGSQMTFHRLPGSFIRTDKANVGLPSSVCHLLQRSRDTGAYLLNGHTWRKGRIGEIHRFRVVADQQNSRYYPSEFSEI
jgi:hypothetical protein